MFAEVLWQRWEPHGFALLLWTSSQLLIIRVDPRGDLLPAGQVLISMLDVIGLRVAHGDPEELIVPPPTMKCSKHYAGDFHIVT